MHDLMLFGQIPEARHDQMMQILAGLCALPNPRPILERRYLFRPKREPVKKTEQIGGSQNVTDVHKAARKAKADEEEFRYSTLIEDLTASDQQDTNGDSDKHDDGQGEGETGPSVAPKYVLQVAELPEPEVKSVMSLARTSSVIKGPDPVSTLENQGQRLVHQYVVQGHQFAYNSIGIRLQRCMKMIAKPEESSGDSRMGLSAFSLRPWDESGAYMIQASVAISDGKNPELLARGTDELKRLREDLRGCVDLRTVERLSMDPRVR